MKLLGSNGMPKIRPAEIEVTEHGLKWWLDRGVKCSDCGETKFLIILNQNRKSISKCAAEKWDIQFTANFICGATGWDAGETLGCGCKFTADYIEKEKFYKKSLYERW